MGCNCAAVDNIDKILKNFGQEYKPKKGDKLALRVKNKIYRFCAQTCLVVMTPFLFSYIVYKGSFGDGKISLTKFLHLKPIEYNVKQQ